jgi:hypothetical protein
MEEKLSWAAGVREMHVTCSPVLQLSIYCFLVLGVEEGRQQEGNVLEIIIVIVITATTTSIFVCLFVFFVFWQYWGLNSEPLEPHLQHFCFWFVFR